MSRSVAELPKVAGTCPEPLTAAIRRAVRSGGSWQETTDRVVKAFGGRVPGPGLVPAREAGRRSERLPDAPGARRA